MNIIAQALLVSAISTMTCSAAFAATICGRAQEVPGENTYARGVRILLQPTGTTINIGTEPRFCFGGLASGSYTLTVVAQCNPFGCWQPTTVTVPTSTSEVSILIPIEETGGGGGGGGSTPLDRCNILPALSCSEAPLTTFDVDVTYIARTPRYRRYDVPYYDCGANGCNSASPYPFCATVPGMPRKLSDGEDPNPVGNCPGLAGDKRQPSANELVTYVAHVKNKGSTASDFFQYTWYVNGTAVLSGTRITPLTVDDSPANPSEATFSLQRPFPGIGNPPESIEFRISALFGGGTYMDAHAVNNSLNVSSHTMSLSWWVAKTQYRRFNRRLSQYTGTHSFEDWMQGQVRFLNNRLAQAEYPGLPAGGVPMEVRVDKVIVTEDPSGPSIAEHQDPLFQSQANDGDLLCIDGRWQTKLWWDVGAAFSQFDDCYVCDHIDGVDRGLIHELGHQLGAIDEYRMNVGNNGGIQVLTEDGNSIPANQIPPATWQQPGEAGIMDGGKTLPHELESYFCRGGDNTTNACGKYCGDYACPDDSLCPNALGREKCRRNAFFCSHTAGGLPPGATKRRGYFGIYLWDTPATTYLRVLGQDGNPLRGARLKLYQKRACEPEEIDNTPEHPKAGEPSVITDEHGIVILTNRSVIPMEETPSWGHQLRPNPFGQIHFHGTNGTMLIKAIEIDALEEYSWLTVADLNLAYWRGNVNTAVITTGPCHEGPDNDRDSLRNICDNCPDIYNPDQLDTDFDGQGNACDPCPSDAKCFGSRPGDTWVNSLAPTENYDADAANLLGRVSSTSKGATTPYIQRVLLAFDLATHLPPAATVGTAELWVYKNPAPAANVAIYRNGATFDPGSVTWNTQPAPNISPTPLSWSLPAASGWISLNVNTLVTDCHNLRADQCSWQIRYTNEVDNVTDQSSLASAQDGVHKPYLRITYVP